MRGIQKRLKKVEEHLGVGKEYTLTLELEIVRGGARSAGQPLQVSEHIVKEYVFRKGRGEQISETEFQDTKGDSK